MEILLREGDDVGLLLLLHGIATGIRVSHHCCCCVNLMIGMSR